jgi:hypothetical protein
MTANCENEIVTLRGEVCLVGKAKPWTTKDTKEHRGKARSEKTNAAPLRRGGAEKIATGSSRRFLQMDADRKLRRKTLNRGHEGTRRKSDRNQISPVFHSNFVPIWEMLRGDETHG